LEYEEVIDLPPSTLEYTESYEDGPTFFIEYREGENATFTETRTYNERDCEVFDLGLAITGRNTNSAAIVFKLSSKISESELEINQFLLKDENDFIDHLSQEIDIAESLTDEICAYNDDKTYLLAGLVQIITDFETGEVDQLKFRIVEEDLDIVKFDMKTIRHDGLGYVMMEVEMNYTAFDLDTNDAPEITFVPVNMKLKHAIRFPEIDK